MKGHVESFFDRMDRFPPILCRLLARVPRGRALTSVEIADKSGLSVMQVNSIATQTDWRGIDIPTARAFMAGCNTDLSKRSHCVRLDMYLRSNVKDPRRRFQFLRKSGEWESYYLPLMQRLHRSLKKP